VTPLTRRTACAASASGLRAICSAVVALTIDTDVRCSSSARLTEPRSAAAVTCTSASCTVAAVSDVFCSTARPAGTATPVTVLAWNPMRRNWSEVAPAGTFAIA
jgi:hypothetical protein